MDAVIFYPTDESQLNQINDFASQNKLTAFVIDEDIKKRIAAIELSNLASKNPKAYATDEEISSAVQEVRHEIYGKKD